VCTYSSSCGGARSSTTTKRGHHTRH
jgi:hypothetical protein